MDSVEAIAIASSNLAAVASLLLSLSAGTLVAVDASQLEGLSTRVALLEAQTLQQGASIGELEGQQVVDAGYYTNEASFTIAKNYNSYECIYDFYVEAGHTFDFIGKWSTMEPHSALRLFKDGARVANSFGDISGRDTISVQYLGLAETDAHYELCFSSWEQDEYVWP